MLHSPTTTAVRGLRPAGPPAHSAYSAVRRPGFALALVLLLVTAVLTGCPTSTDDTGYVDNRPPVTGVCSDPGGLPAAISCVQEGFTITLVASGLDRACKMCEAPDGRIFVSELRPGGTGKVRIIDAAGSLVGTSFHEFTVLGGAEQGLLGVAISPDWGTNNHAIYVVVCVNDSGNKMQVRKLTDTNEDGVADTDEIIVDNLPTNNIHNSGDIQFRSDGTFLLTVGDVANPLNSQTDPPNLAGKVLRFNADGSIPSDNPDPATAEWCRGLRNSYDLFIDSRNGNVYASENGPTVNDELNFILPGKNFEWGESDPDAIPGAQIGFRVKLWADVIAVTGVAMHDGTGFGDAYRDTLFVASYNDEEIIRMRMSGQFLTDIDEEEVFVMFNIQSNDNKPLDVLITSTGDLYISTFTGVWKVSPE